MMLHLMPMCANCFRPYLVVVFEAWSIPSAYCGRCNDELKRKLKRSRVMGNAGA
jgi:hypothetical protein